MKKHVFIFLMTILASNFIFAQTSPFGVGLMAGAPSGLNMKYFLSSKNAVEISLGTGVFGSENSFAMHIDYLYHNHDLIQATEKFPVFYGFGLRIRSREEAEFGMGVRGVIGIAWMSQTTPIDIFVQVAPVFKLLPATKFGIDGSIGARYFF